MFGFEKMFDLNSNGNLDPVERALEYTSISNFINSDENLDDLERVGQNEFDDEFDENKDDYYDLYGDLEDVSLDDLEDEDY